jgi:hypothetical protein
MVIFSILSEKNEGVKKQMEHCIVCTNNNPV